MGYHDRFPPQNSIHGDATLFSRSNSQRLKGSFSLPHWPILQHRTTSCSLLKHWLCKVCCRVESSLCSLYVFIARVHRCFGEVYTTFTTVSCIKGTPIAIMVDALSCSWLVKKNRDQEALSVLSKINSHPGNVTFVDTYIELEELKDSVRKFSGTKLRELFQWKYIYR